MAAVTICSDFGAQNIKSDTVSPSIFHEHRCACFLSCFSRVQLFATLGTAACQAPLPMGLLLARMPEWVAVPSSRGSSRPRDGTHVSYMSSTEMHTGASLVAQTVKLYLRSTWVRSLGRFRGGGNCNSFQYSGLENSVDRGAWQATQSTGSKRVKRL